jgi:SAM-dependent methyltransferase
MVFKISSQGKAVKTDNTIYRACPVCGCCSGTIIHTVSACGFDDDPMITDEPIQLFSCKACSMVFTDISQSLLENHYNDRSVNMGGTGMGAGLNSPADYEHYNRVYEIIRPQIIKDSLIVDYGCGHGGFLHFLRSKNFTRTIGFDLDRKTVETLKGEGFEAYFDPLEHASLSNIDMIVCNLIFEHLFNPVETLQSLHSLLSKNGTVFIEVPDLRAFTDVPYFPFFHFALIEHINYFTLQSLQNLCAKAGFTMIDSGFNIYDMGNGVLNPMCWGVFKPYKSGFPIIPENTIFNEHETVNDYLELSHHVLDPYADIISECNRKEHPIFFRGASLELFAFLGTYAHILKTDSIRGIIDSNPAKQGRYIRRIPIFSSQIALQISNTKDTVVVIMSIIHQRAIEAELKTGEFIGKILRQ